MYSGYICKRNAPISPPAMQKYFAVLWGTLLLDYESEEEAKTSIQPKFVCEVLGISEWDGIGRANQYQNGFILVTHTGTTYYATAPTQQERDDWILYAKRALECNFANPQVLPFKPSKILQSRPNSIGNALCPRTRQTLSSNPIICKACGRGFSSSEFVQELSTVLQIGVEQQEKTCLDCSTAQSCILWLKSLNYIHVMTLHEQTPCVYQDIHRYKATFKLRRRGSTRLDMAATLLEQGQVSMEEFEELRKVDHEYRREIIYDDSGRLKIALDAIGDDMQTLIGLLINPTTTDKGARLAYYQIIIQILDIADRVPELIDFYWPQLVQVHLLFAGSRSEASMVKVDLLQQALLAMAQKHPPLALKLAWALMSSIADYSEKKPSQQPTVSSVQHAACVCLLLQLEMAITGFVSCIADVPVCRTLARLLRASCHQQQELGYELGVLFLVRRQLQEVYDDENAQQQLRYKSRHGAVDQQSSQAVVAAGDASGSSNYGDDDGSDRVTARLAGQDIHFNNANNSGSNISASVRGIGAAVLAEQVRRDGDTPPVTPRGGGGGGGGIEDRAHTNSVSDPVQHRSSKSNSGGGGGKSPSKTTAAADAWKPLPPHLRGLTCLELMNSLGVGEKHSHSRVSESNSCGTLSSDDDDCDKKDNNNTSNLRRLQHGSRSSLSSAANSNSNLAGMDVPEDTVVSSTALAQSWFVEQLDMTDDLTSLVEALRFVDRPLRTETFRKEMIKWNKALKFGWDATACAGEPVYRIKQVIVEDCRVFRTKARAPTMVVCEVLREDVLYVDPSANFHALTARNKEMVVSGSSGGVSTPTSSLSLSRQASAVDMPASVEDIVITSHTTVPASSLSSSSAGLLSVPVSVLPPANYTAHHHRTTSPSLGPAVALSRTPSSSAASSSSSTLTHHAGAPILRTRAFSSDDHDVKHSGTTDHTSPVTTSTSSSASSATMAALHRGGTAVGVSTTEDELVCIDQVQHMVDSSISQAILDIHKTQTQQPSSDTMLPSPEDMKDLLADDGEDNEQNSDCNEAVLAANKLCMAQHQRTIRHSVAAAAPMQGSGSTSRASVSYLSSNRKSTNFFRMLEAVNCEELQMSPRPGGGSGQKAAAGSPAPARRTSLSSGSAADHNNNLSYSSSSHSNSPVTAAAGRSHRHSTAAGAAVSSVSCSDLSNLVSTMQEPLEGENDPRTQRLASSSHGLDELSLDDIDDANIASFVSKKVLNSAQKLLQSGQIDEAEYRELIMSDCKFTDATVREEASITTRQVQSAFGEPWLSKKERILGPRRFCWSVAGKQQQQHGRNHHQHHLQQPQLQHVAASGESASQPSPGKKISNLTNTDPSVADSSGVGAGVSYSSAASVERGYFNSLISHGLINEPDCNFSPSPHVPPATVVAVPATEDTALFEADEHVSNKSAVSMPSSLQLPMAVAVTVQPESSSSSSSSTAGPMRKDDWVIWDLRCFIVKSNDDLRQEVCCLQLMQLCREIFVDLTLSRHLWLNPYRIVSTGYNTGIVEVLTDAMSIDALKKTAGFTTLANYFTQTYGSSQERLTLAKRNFASSLAAYSLFCYIFAIKDRHNGNMLIDTDGHIIHIDFGFMLSIAPGGSFSLETAPFKLTEEMVEVLGGLESQHFGEFVKAFTIGFLALRANAENIMSTLQILSASSPFPCFSGKDSSVILDKMRGRFRADLSVKDGVKHCLDLIIASYGHYGTKQYDSFQWYTNGIMP